MLLWIAKGCVLPGQLSTSHCKYCAEEDHLIPCQLCMEWLCPKHRWGTGSLSDGYYCIAGHDTDPRLPKPVKHEVHFNDLPLWGKYKLMIKRDPTLAIIVLLSVIASCMALALAIIQITLAVMGQPNWPNHH